MQSRDMESHMRRRDATKVMTCGLGDGHQAPGSFLFAKQPDINSWWPMPDAKNRILNYRIYSTAATRNTGIMYAEVILERGVC